MAASGSGTLAVGGQPHAGGAGNGALAVENADGTHPARPSPQTLHSLDWTNFLMADVRDGLGPFLAIVLQVSYGWHSGDIGMAMAVGAIATALSQVPAGWLVDAVRWKRALVAGSGVAVALASLAIPWKPEFLFVMAMQVVLGVAGAVIPPALAALSLGSVGAKRLPARISRNEAFNHAGNFVAAILAGVIGQHFGQTWLFYLLCIFAFASAVTVGFIRAGDIDHAVARGSMEPPLTGGDGNEETDTTDTSSATGTSEAATSSNDVDIASIGNTGNAGQNAKTTRTCETGVECPTGLTDLMRRRDICIFLGAILLFHFGNGAMLPLAGQMIAKTRPGMETMALSACVVAAQAVMLGVAIATGRAMKAGIGAKPIFLVAFLVLPLRGVLFAMTDHPYAVIAIQMLDGVSAGIFGVIAIVMVAQLTRGTGRFNLMQGLVALSTGIGGALSNLIGGHLVDTWNFRAAFLFLATVSVVACLLFGLGMRGKPRGA